MQEHDVRVYFSCNRTIRAAWVDLVAHRRAAAISVRKFPDAMSGRPSSDALALAAVRAVGTRMGLASGFSYSGGVCIRQMHNYRPAPVTGNTRARP
jgi:hypothetical protein